MRRITVSKATVYNNGVRRYFSRASALKGLAHRFIKEHCECIPADQEVGDAGAWCWSHENQDFAIREITALFKRAENDQLSDEWVLNQWNAIAEAEMQRQQEQPK